MTAVSSESLEPGLTTSANIGKLSLRELLTP